MSIATARPVIRSGQARWRSDTEKVHTIEPPAVASPAQSAFRPRVGAAIAPEKITASHRNAIPIARRIFLGSPRTKKLPIGGPRKVPRPTARKYLEKLSAVETPNSRGPMQREGEVVHPHESQHQLWEEHGAGSGMRTQVSDRLEEAPWPPAPPCAAATRPPRTVARIATPPTKVSESASTAVSRPKPCTRSPPSPEPNAKHIDQVVCVRALADANSSGGPRRR